MRDYGELVDRKEKMPEAAIAESNIENVKNWKEAYYIGQFVYEQDSDDAYKTAMDAYEKAFDLGLNINTNRECFLTATQQIARIYFHFQKYEETVNKLMVLDANVEVLPDWIHLYYAAAQIHTENILYWAEKPDIFFGKIGNIHEDDQESVRRRKYLFLEFLNRISALAKTKDISHVDSKSILQKADELGLSESRECQIFKYSLGIIKLLPELPDGPEKKSQYTGYPEEKSSVYDQMVTEFNKRIAELQAIIEKQTLIINQHDNLVSALQMQIRNLQNEKKNIGKRLSEQKKEIRTSRERENAALARNEALKNQFKGNQEAGRKLEEYSATIGGLQIDIEDLKAALKVVRKKNNELQTVLDEKKVFISRLEKVVQQSQENNQQLRATIESQKVRIEIAEKAVRESEESFKKIRTESKIQVGGNSGDDGQKAFPADVLTFSNFLLRKQKILIIGGSEIKENHLRGKLKSLGFVFSKEQLEFELEYGNVKDYASRIRPWSDKYAGIIVGPCPHKAKDIDGYSSFIEQMKSEEGYPHVEEARDKSGILKISNASIGDAMMRMAVYLLSVT